MKTREKQMLSVTQQLNLTIHNVQMKVQRLTH